MTTRDFLQVLWPEDLSGIFYLSTIEKKGDAKALIDTYWFDDIGEAAGYIPKLNGADIYYGVGLAKERPAGRNSKKVRCKADNVAAIPALWVDLDVEKKGSKKRYFPDRGSARTFLMSLPLTPSILVWSGGGYHAYWLFEEPVEINNDGERQFFSDLSEGWQKYMRDRAGRDGIAIDSTFNLDRILRVPGTVNHKWGVDVEVETCNNDLRYSQYDFEDYVGINVDLLTQSEKYKHNNTPHNKKQSKELTTAKYNNITLDFNKAQPPAEKFADLCEIEPRFKKTWDRARKLPDSSASGYDLSLASFAAHAGWTDQEIVDLLIANRRKHGDDLKKLGRSDYLFNPVRGIITKATIAVQDREALLEMQEMTTVVEQERAEDLSEKTAAEPSGESSEQIEGEKLLKAKEAGKKEKKRRMTREQCIDKIRKFTGIPVLRIIKYGARRNGRYVLVMDGGVQESLGEVSDFRSQETWVDMSCVYGSKIMKPLKRADWLKTPLTIINSVVETIDIEEMNDEVVTLSWVRSMADYAPNYSFSEKKDVDESGCFIFDGMVWLQAAALIKDVAMKGGGRFSHAKMCERLKNAGLERRTFVHYSTKSKQTKKDHRRWRSYFTCDWVYVMGLTDGTAQQKEEENDGEEQDDKGQAQETTVTGSGTAGDREEEETATGEASIIRG